MPVIYQRAQTDSKIKYDFVQNLWLLANGIPEDTTIALGVFYYQILHENQGRAGFKIDRMRFINCFKLTPMNWGCFPHVFNEFK